MWHRGKTKIRWHQNYSCLVIPRRFRHVVDAFVNHGHTAGDLRANTAWMSATNGESIAFGQTLSVPAQSRWIRTGRMKHICVSALGRSTNVFLAREYNLRISRKVPLSYHAVTFKIFLLWFSSLYCTLHMFFTFLPNTQRSAFPISIFIMHELASKHTSWGKKRKLGSEDGWVLLISNKGDIYHFHSDFFFLLYRNNLSKWFQGRM